MRREAQLRRDHRIDEQLVFARFGRDVGDDVQVGGSCASFPCQVARNQNKLKEG
ncbi:hypothetical protein [Sphingomonas sp. Ant20]|uniref:hypothetical protein n=1 Tax=Sphingomonas sp. Ant20 TaxID=104605 RepID=UPI0018E3720A|nr:hypothetical protein [Sphingomonas sp. Ant20]